MAFTLSLPNLNLAVDGSASAPSYSFLADSDTGMYRVSANTIGFSTGGTLRLSISATLITSTIPYLASSGTAAAPGIAFASDASNDSGFYYIGANNIGVSAGGTLRWDWSSTAITSTIPYLASSGTAGAPGLAFASDASNDSGFYLIGANNIGASAGGTLRWDWSAAAITSTIPYLASSGTAGAPGIAFASDASNDSGFYLIGANNIGASAGGTLRWDWSATVITSTIPYLASSGTAGAPGLAFASDASNDSGFYLIGANNIGASAGGTLRWDWSATVITSTIPYLASSGTAGAPGLAFASDASNDSGFYLIGANNIGASAGGTLRWDWSATAITSTIPYLASSGTASAPGIAFASDADLNSGFYLIGADNIGWSAGGTLRLDVTGDRVKATVPYYGADGSAAGPTYAFTASPNSGVYHAGGDAIGISSGGTVRLTVSSTAVTPAVKIVASSAGIQIMHSDANTTAIPTNAELVSAFGAAATVGQGFIGTLDDADAHATGYFIWSDGTKYWYVTGTAAP